MRRLDDAISTDRKSVDLELLQAEFDEIGAMRIELDDWQHKRGRFEP